MVSTHESSQVEQDIILLEKSKSPVAQALAIFLQDVVLTGDFFVLEEHLLPNDAIYGAKTEKWSLLRALPDNDDLGTVIVKITRNHRYYLIYSPRGSEYTQPLGEVYSQFDVAEGYELQTDMIVLEIDMNVRPIAARPVVLITEQETSTIEGGISRRLFTPANLAFYKTLVVEVRMALGGVFLEINNLPFRRRPDSSIPTF